MINITEKQLRDTLQTELGAEGVWDYDLENEIVKRIKAFDIPIVSRSLPSKSELNLKVGKELIEWDYNDLTSKTIFERGFKSCFYWFKNTTS